MRIERLPCIHCEQVTVQGMLAGDQVMRLLDLGARIPTFPVEGCVSTWFCLKCERVFVHLIAEADVPPGALWDARSLRKEHR